ncbi:MAG: hypothetical protein ACE5EC_03145 [Phycisphaerae bacterium]
MAKSEFVGSLGLAVGEGVCMDERSWTLDFKIKISDFKLGILDLEPQFTY